MVKWQICIHWVDIFWDFYRIANFSTNKYNHNVNDRNARKRCDIYSELIIKTPEQSYWCRFGVLIVIFEHISHLFLVFLLLTFDSQNIVGFPKKLLISTDLPKLLSKLHLHSFYQMVQYKHKLKVWKTTSRITKAN